LVFEWLLEEVGEVAEGSSAEEEATVLPFSAAVALLRCVNPVDVLIRSEGKKKKEFFLKLKMKRWN
jgi:hypothetical protein